MDEYIRAVESEARPYKNQPVDTVYWGGGTPALLNQQQIGRLVDFINNHFEVDRKAEWTIEANPENLDLTKARFLNSMGFNRLSIGIQSFDDSRLKFLGRNHDSEMALKAYESARAGGFENINVDLMFSFPGQTIDDIACDIVRLKSLRSEHVSLYGLTVEENSRFYVKRLKLDDQDLQARQYQFICEQLENHDLKQYEVSNFARKGFESVHNSNYWNGHSYIGLGVGAHSFMDNRRSWNVSKLAEYLQRVELGVSPCDGFEELSQETLLMERILLGLRKNEGIDIERIQQALAYRLSEDRLVILEEFVKEGFLLRDNAQLKATIKGRLVLDELSSRLI